MPKINISVTGLHCASCAQIITNELKKDANIKAVRINPVTEIAELEITDLSIAGNLNRRLDKLGYHLNFPNKETAENITPSLQTNEQKNKKLAELKIQKKRLQFAIPLMSIILIVIFWSLAGKYWPLQPSELIPNNILTPLTGIIATIILFGLGQNFLKAAGRFIRYGRANMDTLIGIGTGTAYFYSAIIYLFPTMRQNLGLAEMYFFDVTIVVINLVYLGKYLENRAKLYTDETIEKLINLQTKTATVEKSGQESEVPISELNIDDMVIVKPGMKIPADGIVISGESAIDESLLSGESLPIDKKPGDQVIGATINCQGLLKIRVNRIGAETALATIIRAVEEAQNSQAPIQKIADQVAGIFVPIILTIAAITLSAWLIVAPRFIPWNEAVSLGLTCFVSVLAIACPCALGLATPTGIMVGLGLASQNGLLIKNATSLEKLGQTKIMVFDKTGTITYGKPIVTDILAITAKRTEILSIAGALEKNSEHPLAQAVINLAKQENIILKEVENFKAIPGQGVKGQIDNQQYYLGNQVMIRSVNSFENTDWPKDKIDILEKQGKTLMILSTDQEILGILALADEVKSESASIIKKLQDANIKTIMVSGDRQAAVDYIARRAGIEQTIAEVSPLEKAEKIHDLQQEHGVVTMVGDGINDAVALTTADIGVAMATGSDIAIESADITILNGDLSKIGKAINISRLTLKKIKQNLFWAFAYNIIAIPVAAGLFYPLNGWLLSPIIAAGAMSMSSISVILNTLLMRRSHIN